MKKHTSVVVSKQWRTLSLSSRMLPRSVPHTFLSIRNVNKIYTKMHIKIVCDRNGCYLQMHPNRLQSLYLMKTTTKKPATGWNHVSYFMFHNRTHRCIALNSISNGQNLNDRLVWKSSEMNSKIILSGLFSPNTHSIHSRISCPLGEQASGIWFAPKTNQIALHFMCNFGSTFPSAKPKRSPNKTTISKLN